MAATNPVPPTAPAQFTPRFRTDIYPFIEPSKFRGALQGKVAMITGIVCSRTFPTPPLLPLSKEPNPNHPPLNP